MSYYGNMYNIPVGYQQPYVQPVPGQYGSFVTPTTTAQQMMTQQQVQPVQQVVQPVQQVQPVQTVANNASFNGIIVNSFEEVKDYPTPIGGLTLLLNKKERKFYIKSLNDNGVPVIETYNFDTASNNIIDTQPQQDDKQYFDMIIQRLDAVERKLKIE